MKKASALILALLFLAAQTVEAQRYLKPVFTDVAKTTAIYGANTDIITLQHPSFLKPIKLPLVCDVYSPVGDTATNRPVVVYWHTGNFLPHPQNGGTGGKRTDKTAVEFCKQLAGMGYVAISADYRLGWNPLANDSLTGQTTRVFTLINAAYRGVQDCKTMARFIKRTVAEQGNPMGIDPSKICMFGQGTGGYITLAASALDTITETYLPKFFLPTGLPAPNNFLPMVLDPINGNVEGTNVGRTPQGHPGYPPPSSATTGGFYPGDTLCYPNHVGYSSSFAMAINLGGAMGDKSWIQGGKGPAGIPPTITFHAPSDPFAPYNTGVLKVPVFNYPVVEVSGGGDIQPLLNAAGVNDIWKNNADLDKIGLTNLANPTALEALYDIQPNVQLGESTISPYDQWDFPGNPNATAANDSVAARKYMVDTVLAYFAPRACLALGLGCDLKTLAAPQLDDAQIGLVIAPNPAQDQVVFSTENEPIQSIYVYDLAGRLVKAHVDIESSAFTMSRNSLGAGVYLAEIRFEKGVVTKKVIFE